MSTCPKDSANSSASFRVVTYFKVAVVYTAVAWLTFQVADLIFQAMPFPDWAFSLVVVLGILGAPIALVLAWAYDLTPEGVVRTNAAASQETATLPVSPPVPSPGPTPRADAPDLAPISRCSVAVLPFANLSGAPESDHFSDGIPLSQPIAGRGAPR